ncbi:MAG: hypothetical protein ABI413_14525 [Ktedonobacteraceae bacterium]
MTTTEHIFNNFKETMSGLEKGLQVIHITTPTAQLLCCHYDDDAATVFARPDILQFDQIPVKREETIIGLLNRREYVAGTTQLVKDHMRPLSEGILVSADTPLLEFIHIDPLDRLVIQGTHIYGLVTRSDFLKLPVRLLGFALVTHIEAQMLAIIQSTGIDKDVWLGWVPPNNKEDLQKRYSQLVQERANPDILELTSFFDKSHILQKLISLDTYASLLPPKECIDQIKRLVPLRNMLAHGGNTSDDHSTLQTFIDRLRLVRTSIQSIEQWQKERTL